MGSVLALEEAGYRWNVTSCSAQNGAGRDEAHDMIMSLFGGLSKGERNRVRTRVRSSMAAIAATEGRYLGGRS